MSTASKCIVSPDTTTPTNDGRRSSSSQTMGALQEILRDLERRTAALEQGTSNLQATIDSRKRKEALTAATPEQDETVSSTSSLNEELPISAAAASTEKGTAATSTAEPSDRVSWLAMQKGSVSCLESRMLDDDEENGGSTVLRQSKLVARAAAASRQSSSLWDQFCTALGGVHPNSSGAYYYEEAHGDGLFCDDEADLGAELRRISLPSTPL